jgi:hypothetical protein
MIITTDYVVFKYILAKDYYSSSSSNFSLKLGI